VRTTSESSRESAFSDLKRQVQESGRKVKSLSTQLSSLSDENSDLKQQLDEATRRIELSSSEMSSICDENSKLKAQLSKAQRQQKQIRRENSQFTIADDQQIECGIAGTT
jgi:chromosome segregation ATPase